MMHKKYNLLFHLECVKSLATPASFLILKALGAYIRENISFSIFKAFWLECPMNSRLCPLVKKKKKKKQRLLHCDNYTGSRSNRSNQTTSMKWLGLVVLWACLAF